MLRALLILVMTACLALAACGDDDEGGGGGDGGSGEKVSAEAYATDVCDSTQEWVSDLQTRATDLTKDLGGGADVSPADGKEALVGFMEDVITDTEDWAQAVEDAGVPDVDGGEEYAQDFQTAAEDAKGVLEETQAGVENLPTDNEQRFAREAEKVGDATSESLGKVGDAISASESKELQTAFEDTPSCKKLAAG